MKKYVKLLAAAALLTATLVTASASDVPLRAIREMENVPTSWSPLETSSEAEFLQDLTGGSLKISSDLVTDFQDVTAEYAGNELYGIPENAVRGYAYRITLNENACWDDETPINANSWLNAARDLLENGSEDLLILANAKGCLDGSNRTQVVSLGEAGYGSMAAAQEAGITDFYLDVENYWGLGDGWRSITDITRLKDHAITQGSKEMYVSAAWLYDQYLADERPYAYFQSEFVGIAGEGTPLTLEDVGILKTGDYELVLILEEPEAETSLKMKLADFRLVREGCFYRSAEDSASYGPYRVKEVTSEGIRLEKNPNWWGAEGRYEQILCR